MEKFRDNIKVTFGYIGFITLVGVMSMACHRENDTSYSQVDILRQHIDKYDRITANEKEKAEIDSIGQLVKKLPNSEETRELMAHYIRKTYADMSYIDLLSELATKDNDQRFEARSYYLKGVNYESRFVFDTAYYYYTKAEYIYTAINDTVLLRDVYRSKGVVLLNNRIFTEAQSNVLKLIRLNKYQDDIKVDYMSKLILGSILAGLGETDEAIVSLFEALDYLYDPRIDKIYNENVKRLNFVTVYKNIVEAYLKKEDYEVVRQLVDETIDKYLGREGAYDDILTAQLITLKATANIAEKKVNGVESELKKAIAFNIKHSNPKDENIAKIALGELLFLKGDSEQAVSVLNEVRAYTIKFNDLALEKEVLSKLLKFDKVHHQEYFIRYEELGDLLTDENRMIKNTFARISYEADFLIKANKKLQSQKDVITQVGSTMLGLAVLIFFIILFRQKSREVKMVKLFQQDTEKYYSSILTIHDKMGQARSHERKEVAKELHDGVLNKLFVTRFSLMQITENTLEKQRNLLINEVKEVEEYIRGVSHSLGNEESFKISFYNQLLEDLVQIQNRNEQTEFTLVIAPELDLQNLCHRIKIHLYRIIQEALQNVHKYAKATNCIVIFRKLNEGGIELLIKDNGVGFEVKKVKRGLGLNNIQDRCDLVNAFFHIQSAKGKGTTLRIVIG